jgi:hypothetical protein
MATSSILSNKYEPFYWSNISHSASLFPNSFSSFYVSPISSCVFCVAAIRPHLASSSTATLWRPCATERMAAGEGAKGHGPWWPQAHDLRSNMGIRSSVQGTQSPARAARGMTVGVQPWSLAWASAPMQGTRLPARGRGFGVGPMNASARGAAAFSGRVEMGPNRGHTFFNWSVGAGHHF